MARRQAFIGRRPYEPVVQCEQFMQKGGAGSPMADNENWVTREFCAAYASTEHERLQQRQQRIHDGRECYENGGRQPSWRDRKTVAEQQTKPGRKLHPEPGSQCPARVL